MSLYFGFSQASFCLAAGSLQLPSDVQNNKVFHVDAETSYEKLGGDKVLLVPDVPAQDITASELNSCELSATIPLSLSRPLLKCNKASEPLEGYHSGRRSALVYVDGVWYRLKGCGDLEDGITTRGVDDGSGKYVEIRGVQFENTSAREIYITQLVNNALRQYGMAPANESLAYWIYDTTWPVQCTCGIFKTNGDRRLNDHVLLGLETMLPLLVDETDIKAIEQLFPQGRITDDQVLPTWLAAFEDDVSSLIDLRASKQREHFPTVEQFIEKFGPHDLIARNIEVLQQSATKTPLLPHLYWKLGWEAGKILRMIHNATVSWGTYPDKLGIHCNAHSNNFILLPPNKSTEGQLLAPLDFDMAFTQKSVTSLTFVDSFSKLLEMEVRSLRLALAGDADLNTGTRGVAPLPASHNTLKWVLRDTIVKGFHNGYHSPLDAKFGDTNLEAEFRALLELSLIVSKDVVA